MQVPGDLTFLKGELLCVTDEPSVSSLKSHLSTLSFSRLKGSSV